MLFDSSGTTCLLGIRIMCPILFVPENDMSSRNQDNGHIILFVQWNDMSSRNQDNVSNAVPWKTCRSTRIMVQHYLIPRRHVFSESGLDTILIPRRHVVPLGQTDIGHIILIPWNDMSSRNQDNVSNAVCSSGRHVFSESGLCPILFVPVERHVVLLPENDMSFHSDNQDWTHYPDSEKTCRSTGTNSIGHKDNVSNTVCPSGTTCLLGIRIMCPMLFVPVERHVFSESG